MDTSLAERTKGKVVKLFLVYVDLPNKSPPGRGRDWRRKIIPNEKARSGGFLEPRKVA